MKFATKMVSGLLGLCLASLIACGSKNQDTLTATTTVAPEIGGGAMTSAVTPVFVVMTQISDPSMADKVTVTGGHVYYTTDGTDPIIGGAKSVILKVGEMIYSESGYALESEAAPSISTTTTLKYIADVTFSQQKESSKMGMKMKSEDSFAGVSEAGSAVYTFNSTNSDGSTSQTSGTEPAPAVATVYSVSLTAAASSGSSAPTAAYCFALYAKPLDSSGTVVSAPSDTTFTLTSVTGSGTFYSNAGCSSAITSSTISASSSSKTIFYKDNNREAITLRATYNGIAGTAYSKTLGNPYIGNIQFATSANNTQCQSISMYLKDASSQIMIESTTTPVTIIATRLSGPSASPHFYTDNTCTTQVTETGSGVHTLTIAAGQSGSDYYFNAGSPGTYVYNLAWSCGSDSGTFQNSFVFYHL